MKTLLTGLLFLVLKIFLAIITTSCCGYTDFFLSLDIFFSYKYFSPEDRKHFFRHSRFFLVGSLVNLWIGKIFFSLSLSRESPQGLVRLTLIYSPFSISFDDFGTRFLFASQWDTRHGLFLSVASEWDNDWNETLFPVLTFGIWCKSVCLFSVLKQTINQQLEALGLQLLLDRLRGQELVFRGMSYKKRTKRV